jgi:hypothetical protein
MDVMSSNAHAGLINLYHTTNAQANYPVQQVADDRLPPRSRQPVRESARIVRGYKNQQNT